MALLMATINSFAQQTFDIITFTAPKAWEQKPSDAGIQGSPKPTMYLSSALKAPGYW